LQDFSRKRALEGDETVGLAVRLQVAESDDGVDGVVPVGEGAVDEAVVFGATAGVCDDVEEVFGALFQSCDDAVVDDAAGLGVQQGAESGVAGREILDTGGSDAFEERFGAGTFDVVLHHVADVEDGGLLAGPLVALANAEVTVLHGHAVAAERHHLGAVGEVQIVQISFAQVGVIVESWRWRDLGALVAGLLLTEDCRFC
jgi:hypothetical protein